MNIEERIAENIANLQKQLLDVTLPLVALKPGATWPHDFASGFLIQKNGRFFVITAGHKILESNWLVELRVDVDNQIKAILIPLRSVRVIAGQGSLKSKAIIPVDFAWAEIDLEAVRAQASSDRLLQGKPIEIPHYLGPLDHYPNQDEPYAFCAYNKAKRGEHCDLKFLRREPAMEFGMDFIGKDKSSGEYRFQLPREHRGDEYYEGASGAPIADPEGKIISIVLGSPPNSDEIWGAPLADLQPYVGVIE